MFRFVHRTPLRVQLVAAVLVLVTAALTVIGVASSVALRGYMFGQVDSQLTSVASSIDVASIPRGEIHGFIPPTNYLIVITDIHGISPRPVADPALHAGGFPVFPSTLAQVQKLAGKPYTVRSVDGSRDWRMLIIPQANGQLLIVGQLLSDVEGAIHRLLTTELIVGGATLLILATLGIAMIRTSLRPLAQVESTAEAIAAGDLTQRLPDFEPGTSEPKTEVGRLGRAFNTMVDQIELSFQARAASEAAARELASTANAAAGAAQRSEVRARRSEERMRQFAADASHELRTPLTTIRGFAELYRQGAARAPEETARLLRRIEDEAARMGLLVEDMLLLARLDQERPLANAPVDLRVIATDAVVNAKALAPDRPVQLAIAKGAGPLTVIGDELRLRQIMTNLMSNALTHTPESAAITVGVAPSARPGYIDLSVSDDGPGLTAEQRDRIFERFYRADSARTRHGDGPSGGGTGLGLAIVAALVGAHGGTVDVESEPGSGATFRVTLPATQIPDPDQDSEVPPSSATLPESQAGAAAIANSNGGGGLTGGAVNGGGLTSGGVSGGGVNGGGPNGGGPNGGAAGGGVADRDAPAGGVARDDAPTRQVGGKSG